MWAYGAAVLAAAVATLISQWKKDLDGSLVAIWHEFRRNSGASGYGRLYRQSESVASRKSSVTYLG